MRFEFRNRGERRKAVVDGSDIDAEASQQRSGAVRDVPLVINRQDAQEKATVLRHDVTPVASSQLYSGERRAHNSDIYYVEA